MVLPLMKIHWLRQVNYDYCINCFCCTPRYTLILGTNSIFQFQYLGLQVQAEVEIQLAAQIENIQKARQRAAQEAAKLAWTLEQQVEEVNRIQAKRGEVKARKLVSGMCETEHIHAARSSHY